MYKAFSFSFLFPVLFCYNQAASQTIPKANKQIPVIAFYGIPSENTSVERYTELKQSGITYNITSFADIKSIEQALKTAQKTGVKLIVSCPELKTKTKETVKTLMKYPALAGYFVTDEPNRHDFSELGKWVSKIRAADDSHFCYLNIFPNYATPEQLGTATYREYVKQFIQEVPIKYLSFDHYPVIGDSLRREWYENLEIFSEETRAAKKSFWAFALTVSHELYPIPTVAELRLQIYSNLAYGAQGIQYFTYWTPPKNDTWNFHHGPITLDFKRSEVYDRVKLVNNEIKNLSNVFLGATVISVAHTGTNIPIGTKRLSKLPRPISKLETQGEGAVVSLLQKGKETFLVIVNRDFKKPMSLTILCDPTVKKVLKDGTAVPASTYIDTMDIDAGDVAIYKWLRTGNE